MSFSNTEGLQRVWNKCRMNTVRVMFFKRAGVLPDVGFPLLSQPVAAWPEEVARAVWRQVVAMEYWADVAGVPVQRPANDLSDQVSYDWRIYSELRNGSERRRYEMRKAEGFL